jgi:hypothetical protein
MNSKIPIFKHNVYLEILLMHNIISMRLSLHLDLVHFIEHDVKFNLYI